MTRVRITFSDYKDPKCAYPHICRLGCRGRRELFSPISKIIMQVIDLLFKVFGLEAL
jgi:hypothetical protein